MGEPVVAGFGVLLLIGIALVVLGTYRRAMKLVRVGLAILLAVAGAWTLGSLGGILGFLPLTFLRRGRQSGAV
jgi:hypothetical protein